MYIRLFGLSLLLLLSFGCGRTDITGTTVDCVADEDCNPAANETCVAGECVDGTVVNNGTNNDLCAQNTCLTTETCDPSNGACLDASCDLEDGDLCYGMVCTDEGCGEQPCTNPCGPGEDALGCGCVESPCEDDSDCSGGSVCGSDGVCGPCVDDSQCLRGEICSMGLCILETECQMDSDCGAEQECNPEGYCVDRDDCVLDDDCEDGQLCIGGICTLAPQCRADMDCPDGFECIANNCFEKVCRGPSDCETDEVCDAGECVTPPVSTRCVVATPSGYISQNQTIPLEAFAYDDLGNGVAALFSWSSSNPAVAVVDPTGKNALGVGGVGTTVFTATLASGDPIACEGMTGFRDPGPVMPNQLRVVVSHIESSAPVQGATVVVGNTTAQTSAGGIATLPMPAGAFEVSVYHSDFNYITLQGVETPDVRIPLAPRRGDGPVGGFTGQFDLSRIGSQGDINLGIAGASLAGGLLELDLNALLGESFQSRITIPGIIDEEFPIPGGVTIDGRVFAFNLDIKSTYYARSAGGTRFAWGLGGKVPFSELLALGSGGGGDAILTTILPLFSRFDHIAQPILITARPQVPDVGDIDGDGDLAELVPDYGAFPTQNLQPSVRQTLTTDVDISNFPTLKNGKGEVAVLLGGSVLPTPGLVPMGISATNDEDGDGRPDARRLSIAPVAGALAGGRYSITAIAFRTDGVGGSFAFPTDISVALWNGQYFPTAVRLGTFPDASIASVDDQTRSVTFTASAGPLYRVRMVGNDRSWDVWSLGAPGVQGSFAHTITIPASGVSQDLFVGTQLVLDAIQTNVTMNDLVQPTGVGLKNAGLVSSAYSRTAIRP